MTENNAQNGLSTEHFACVEAFKASQKKNAAV